MARSKKKYNLFGRSNPFNAWNRNAGKANAFEELSTAEQKEKLHGAGKGEPASEATSPGVNTSELSKRVTMQLEALALAAGERVVKVTVWCYGTPTSTKGFKFGLTDSGSGEQLAEAIGAAKKEWREMVFTAANMKKVSREHWQKGEAELVLTTTGGKATLNTVWSLYVEVETETETAEAESSGEAHSGESGLGTAEVNLSTGLMPNRLGASAICLIATTGGVPTSVTSGSAAMTTPVLDAEVSNGGVTLQVWRGELTEVATNGVFSIKLPREVVYAISVAMCFIPISGIDVKANGTGSGTALEATLGAAIRATQGDLLLSAFAVGSNSTLTAGEGMTALQGSNGTGISVMGEYNLTPTEGTTPGAKGTASVTGTWAGVVIAYKVLANSGSSLTREATESITITEAASRILSGARSASEGVLLTESTARTLAQARSAADAVTIADVATRAASAPRSATDGIIATEATSRLLAGARSAADTLAIVEGSSRVLSQARSATDSASISESVSVSRGKSISATEAITMSEAAVRGPAGMPRTSSDTLSIAESTTRTLTQARTSSDTIHLVESTQDPVGRPRSAADSITITEGTARAAGAVRSSSDTIAVGEATSVHIATSRTATETIHIVEVASTGTTTIRLTNVSISDSAASSVTLTVRGSYRAVLSDRDTALMTIDGDL